MFKLPLDRNIGTEPFPFPIQFKEIKRNSLCDKIMNINNDFEKKPLNDKKILSIMDEIKCSKKIAVDALIKYNWDVVDAILYLYENNN